MTAWPNNCTLGGITLDVDDGVSFRAVTDLTGWKDAPGSNPGITSKTQQDGAWDGTGFLNERVINLAGFVQEASPGAAYRVQQQLAALRPQTLQQFTVQHPATGLLGAKARITVGVKTSWLNGVSFRYTLQATTPDPLKYGTATTGTAGLSAATPGAGRIWPRAWPTDWGVALGATPGAVSMPNTGSTAYWPVLRVDGPVTNPVVTEIESGAWVRFNGALASGQWLDIDTAARTVLLQGLVSVRAAVTSSGDWLSVPVGGGTITFAADDADPAAQLSVSGYQGAWI